MSQTYGIGISDWPSKFDVHIFKDESYAFGLEKRFSFGWSAHFIAYGYNPLYSALNN